MKLSEIGELDQTLDVVQSPGSDIDYKSISSLDEIESETIVFLKNKKFFEKLCNSNLDENIKLLVIFQKKFFESIELSDTNLSKMANLGFATTENVDESLTRLSKSFHESLFGNKQEVVDGRQMGTADIHPTTWVAQNVFIGERVKIGANCMIHPGAVIMSDVELGDNVTLFPNVVVYPYCELKNNVRVHSSVVIGSDGFGYNFFDGKHQKVWHIGKVLIEDDVEIGSNSCIDRATFGTTVIGAGAKIDNLVQVGHNCKVGRNVILCGQVGLSGSAKLGDFSVLGGKVAIAPDVELGPQCQVAGMAGVTSDWPAKSSVGGHPARPIKEWLRSIATLRKMLK